mmetsp:Transcript_35065/g.31597  ORF Transcript_35065/g.31597 Transcript_35065/m.31597 type:complete len:201 (+) Transcript_35065:748-1350(+)
MVIFSVYAAQKEKNTALQGLSIFFDCFVLIYELIQMKLYGFREYWSNVANIVDFSSSILIIVASIFGWALDSLDPLAVNWVVSVAIIFGYTKLLSYAKVFDNTRRFIRITGEIIWDMRSFIMMLLFIFFSFTIIFICLDEAEEFTFGSMFLLSYNYLFANYESEGLTTSQYIFFVIFTLLLAVVLINMLIAIMGDSYSRV